MFSLTTVIIVLNLALGLAILSQAKKDLGAIIFFFITLAFSLLLVANFLTLTSIDLTKALYWVRVQMFFAAIHTFLFFIFVHVFTKPEFPYSLKRSAVFLIPFVVVLGISLTPLVFSNIIVSAKTGELETIPGTLFGLYAFWLLGTMILSMRHVFVMYRKSEGMQRIQWRFMVGGSFATYFALIICNFFFAGILRNTYFIKYTPLFSLPIIAATAYAIIKHNLFNIKVIATEAFVFIVSIIYIAKVIVATTTTDRVIDGIVFLATFFFGVLLVRSIKQEVESREKIQDLAKRLTEANWELARTNEQLRIIDQRKSEFVSIVSHQLRTPITAMKGYASLLLEGSYGMLSGEQKAPVEKIFTSSNRLATMVTEFLDISKIEQGTMTYTFSPVDVRTMLSELRDEFIKKAEVKGLTLEFIDPGAGSFLVSADDGKIRQCFSNLIDNSIKYTPKGGITISLEKDEAKSKVTCRIKDTGIGLSQEDIHHLFAKFARGTEGQKHNTEGSGIGLYVAKKMIEAQHGNIWIDSEGPGKGSTFVIELSTKVQTQEVPEEKLPK
jgi:signal transduction histidine kinase